MEYVGWKDRKAVAAELEPVIRTPIEPVDNPEDVVKEADIVAPAEVEIDEYQIWQRWWRRERSRLRE